MTPDKIIRNFLLISGLYTLSASLIWGVNTLFLLGAGLDIFEVFIANAAFTAGMALFEIPTGVLADTSGRRASFLLGVLVLVAGTLGYVGMDLVGAGLGLFVLFSVVLGLGFTFYSGAVEAWLVDALKATGYEGNLDPVFARGAFVTGAAMLVGTVGGGALGGINLALPFLGRAILLLLVFGVAYWGMHDVGFEVRALRLSEVPVHMRAVADASLRYGWRQPSMRLLMVASFIQTGFMIWAFYAWQPYFLDLLGQEAVWVSGVVAALMSLAMMAGNALAERLSRFCSRRTTLILWAVAVQAAASIGVGLAGSFWLAVALFLVSMGALGLLTPVKQAYLHQLIPSEQRASIVSLDSMIGSLGGIGGQSGLGYLSQVGSIAAGYVVGGVGLLAAWPVYFALRRRDDPEDHIVGAAGEASACAAQGLPEVAGLDTRAQIPAD